MKRNVPAILLAAVAVLSHPAAAESTSFDFGIVNSDLEGTRLQLFPDDDVKGLRLGLINIENEDVLGLSLSVIATGTKGDFSGLQAAGLRNRVDGDFAGLETGLFWNQHRGRTDGMLLSFAANTVGDELNGTSQAFVLNWCETLDGWQSGPGFILPAAVNRAGEESDNQFFGCVQFGVVNVHGGTMRGCQSLTGFVVPSLVNVAKNVEGIQSGFVNVADTVTGIQFGLLNFADRLRGIQIGLSNHIADDFDTAGFHWLPFINFAAMSF